MRKRTFNVGLIVLFFVFAAVAALSSTLCSTTVANALDVDFTASQNDTVTYCAASYVENGKFVNFSDEEEGFSNGLYSALSFYFDGVEQDIPQEDVTFYTTSSALLRELRTPGTYKVTVRVIYGSSEYDASVTLTISKKTLVARALINGESYAEVLEGETYVTTVVYEGFEGEDDFTVLDSPAYITREPRMPTTGYPIVPEYGSSSLYDIVYASAVIVITANPDTLRTYEANGETVLKITGSFSPYYELTFLSLDINVANVNYVAIGEKLERYYTNNGLLNDYKQLKAYSINMYLDADVAELTDPMNVSIKLDEDLRGYGEYTVVHFATDGTRELLTAKETDDGFVSFNCVELGEFVLMAPIEGVNTIETVALCVVALVVVVIIVLLFALFRRKY